MQIYFDPRIKGYYLSKTESERLDIVDDIKRQAFKFKKAKLSIHGFYKYLDRLIAPLAKKSTCGSFSNCSMCCNQRVRLSNSEFKFLESKEIKKMSVEFKGEDDRSLCPLLKDNKCSVYDRRPIACRVFHVDSNPSKCSQRDWDVISSPEIMVATSAWRTYERQSKLNFLEQYIGA